MKKKIVALVGVLVLTAVGVAGCTGDKEKDSTAEPKGTAKEENTIIIADETEEPDEGEVSVGMGSPWVDITEEEANKQCQRLFKAPEGADGQEWSMCEALGDPDNGVGPLIQLSFLLNELDFTARAQQGAAEDTDISGVFVEWTAGPDDVTLANWGGGNMTGKMYRSIDDSGYLDLITWYDTEIGIKYSLSVAAADLDGFDIQAVAEQMYSGENEASGNISDAPVEVEKSDGIYGAHLKSSDKDKIGTTDEFGLMYTVVYKAILSEDTLNLVGSMNYKNVREQDPISVSDDLNHVFTVDGDTVYQMEGGEDGPEKVSMDEFAGYLKDLIDSGLYVEVEVKDGVVKVASIAA